jgi:hypothetical protein
MRCRNDPVHAGKCVHIGGWVQDREKIYVAEPRTKVLQGQRPDKVYPLNLTWEGFLQRICERAYYRNCLVWETNEAGGIFLHGNGNLELIATGRRQSPWSALVNSVPEAASLQATPRWEGRATRADRRRSSHRHCALVSWILKAAAATSARHALRMLTSTRRGPRHRLGPCP